MYISTHFYRDPAVHLKEKLLMFEKKHHPVESLSKMKVRIEHCILVHNNKDLSLQSKY